MLGMHQTHHFQLKACELFLAVLSLVPQFLNVVVVKLEVIDWGAIIESENQKIIQYHLITLINLKNHLINFQKITLLGSKKTSTITIKCFQVNWSDYLSSKFSKRQCLNILHFWPTDSIHFVHTSSKSMRDDTILGKVNLNKNCFISLTSACQW